MSQVNSYRRLFKAEGAEGAKVLRGELACILKNSEKASVAGKE